MNMDVPPHLNAFQEVQDNNIRFHRSPMKGMMCDKNLSRVDEG